MNILKGTFIAVFVIVSVTLNCYASDLRIYTQAGGMNVTERHISEGHKSYHTFGIENPLSDNFVLTLEGFTRGEPADEDPEIPKWGLALQGKYLITWTDHLHPYLGLRYDHIERGLAPKYQGEDSPHEQRTVHKFSSVLAGVHMETDHFYINLGTVIPWYTNTKSGNFGPDLGIGIKWNHWDLGCKYKEIRFTNHWFETGENDFSFKFIGAELGYSF